MIQLPPVPRGTVVTPQLVRVSGDLVSPLGGPTQRITRLGSRYAASVELPSLDAACAARWLACPLRAEAEGATLGLVMPQMIDVEFMGAVQGTGLAGSNVIHYAGATPQPGMWFSFLYGGRHYLHLVTDLDAANTVVRIAPLLRVNIPATPLEFAGPILEGFVDDTSWSLEYFRFVGHKFQITENA